MSYQTPIKSRAYIQLPNVRRIVDASEEHGYDLVYPQVLASRVKTQESIQGYLRLGEGRDRSVDATFYLRQVQCSIMGGAGWVLAVT